MNQQHILFIIDGLPGGGAENVTLRLADGFHQAGYQVTLLSLHEKLAYQLPDFIDYIVDHDNYRGIFRKLTEISRRAKSLDNVLTQLFAKKGALRSYYLICIKLTVLFRAQNNLQHVMSGTVFTAFILNHTLVINQVFHIG